MQSFRRLRVWERARALAVAIRTEVNRFPRHGYSDLKAQLVRASEAIASNIAEGAGAATRKEFARFLDIAIKSTAEVENHLQFAVDYGILAPARWKDLSDEVVQIRRMLIVLRRRVLEQA